MAKTAQKKVEPHSERSPLTWVEEQLLGIEKRVEGIIEEAEAVIDEYWTFRLRENKLRVKAEERRDKSIMGARVRVRKSGSVTIEWFYNDFVRDSNKKWRVFSNYIRRGKKYRYTDSALLKKCKTWEIEVVSETEDRLAVYREEYDNLMKVKKALTGLMAVYEKNEDVY